MIRKLSQLKEFQLIFRTQTMNSVLHFLLIFVAFASAEDVSNFIIGGSDAALGQFPYMISIRFSPDLRHGCGGGILNTRWILTVKHKY